MCPFIAPHIFADGTAFPAPDQTDKPFHCGRGDLVDMDVPAAQQCAVNLSRSDAGMLFHQEPDPGLQVLVKLTADPFVFPALREKGIKSAFFISAVPFFNRRGTNSHCFSIGIRIGFCRGPAEEFIVAYGRVAGPGLQWCDHTVTEKGCLLLLVKGHSLPPLFPSR